MSNIKDRISEFIDFKGITQNAFEVKAGLGKSYLSNLKDSIGSEKLVKILTAFPELNVEWVITGNGEMLRKSSPPDYERSHNEEQVLPNTVVGGNVSGNGNNISHNDSENIAGMIVLQKGYQELLKKSQQQIDRLIGIIEKGGKE